MSPEQSVEALREISATHFVGMHWDTYDLSDEPIEAGPVLMREAAQGHGLDDARLHVIVPGGSVSLTGPRNDTYAHTRHRYRP